MDEHDGPSLSETLTPALLRQVREFWFEQLQNTEALILPSWENHQRWFLGGEAFDRACVDRFGSAVEAIRDSGVTSTEDLLQACLPSEPLDWLSLVLLLDQMPRNCYRGEAAATVFNFFDPLARGVALAARTRGIPHTTPSMRWRLAYRSWFYLPLMHSEDVALHEQATREYATMQADFDGLADGKSGAEGAESHLAFGDHTTYRAEAVAVVRGRADEARALVRRYADYELRHANIIKQFGRYPHRNAALEREPNAEETAYLAEGETFGQKA